MLKASHPCLDLIFPLLHHPFQVCDLYWASKFAQVMFTIPITFLAHFCLNRHSFKRQHLLETFWDSKFYCFLFWWEKGIKTLSMKTISGNREILSVLNTIMVLWILWLKSINITLLGSMTSQERNNKTKQTKINAGGKLAEITAVLVPCFTDPSQKTTEVLKLWSDFMAICSALNLFKRFKYPTHYCHTHH